MYITTILLAFIQISSEFEECSAQASRFVSHGYLDFVARRLSIHECRRLSESLHMKRVPLDHPVDGSQEPHLHCVEVINFFRLIQLHYIIGSLKYNYFIQSLSFWHVVLNSALIFAADRPQSVF